jgi:hypothetical protein
MMTNSSIGFVTSRFCLRPKHWRIRKMETGTEVITLKEFPHMPVNFGR